MYSWSTGAQLMSPWQTCCCPIYKNKPLCQPPLRLLHPLFSSSQDNNKHFSIFYNPGFSLVALGHTWVTTWRSKQCSYCKCCAAAYSGIVLRSTDQSSPHNNSQRCSLRETRQHEPRMSSSAGLFTWDLYAIVDYINVYQIFSPKLCEWSLT